MSTYILALSSNKGLEDVGGRCNVMTHINRIMFNYNGAIKNVISHAAHPSLKKPMIIKFMVWTLEKSICRNLAPKASYIYG